MKVVLDSRNYLRSGNAAQSYDRIQKFFTKGLFPSSAMKIVICECGDLYSHRTKIELGTANERDA